MAKQGFLRQSEIGRCSQNTWLRCSRIQIFAVSLESPGDSGYFGFLDLKSKPVRSKGFDQEVAERAHGCVNKPAGGIGAQFIGSQY